MDKIREAIEHYFETAHRNSGGHACGCGGCSAERAALHQILLAFREVEWSSIPTVTEERKERTESIIYVCGRQ